MFSDDPILPWLEAVRVRVPGLELFDCHTHIGSNDPDGLRCHANELLSALDRVDARAVVFPMHEPDGYPPANDAVIEAASDSGGRLVPFCRLDPNDAPLVELERSMAAGVRGVKLHPRAEPADLAGDELRDCLSLAAERRLPVLVHAGRGIPALGAQALEVCERHPTLPLILAHAGICDLAWIWRAAPAHPNLYFDTSWWSPGDLRALLSLVPSGQVLFGSDAPYSTPAFGAVLALRHALQAGLGEAAVASVGGRQAARLIAGEEPAVLGGAREATAPVPDPLLDRIHTFLVAAIGQMLGGGASGQEPRALARLACEVGDGAPQAGVCRAVLGLLDQAERYAEGRAMRGRYYPGVHLVVLAATVVRTPDVPAPELSEPADVGKRVR